MRSRKSVGSTAGLVCLTVALLVAWRWEAIIGLSYHPRAVIPPIVASAPWTLLEEQRPEWLPGANRRSRAVTATIGREWVERGVPVTGRIVDTPMEESTIPTDSPRR